VLKTGEFVWLKLSIANRGLKPVNATGYDGPEWMAPLAPQAAR
jgi:hypothetical protein